MQYETYPIMGAGDPPLHPGEVNDVADGISSVYETVTEKGGQVIATHTLACDIDISDADDETPKSTRVEMLFLVAEFPDDSHIEDEYE